MIMIMMASESEAGGECAGRDLIQLVCHRGENPFITTESFVLQTMVSIDTDTREVGTLR